MPRTVLYVYLGTLCLYIVLRLSFGDSLWWLSLLNTFAAFLFVPLLVALPLAWCKRWYLGLTLTSLLSVVGLLWFGPGLSLGPRGVLEGLRLEVVTYNMKINAEGLEAWLKQMDADIVMLQEVPKGFAKDIPALREQYPYQLDQPEWQNTILSRYPLSETEAATDVPVQHAEVTVNGRNLALYNVHLRWPIGEPRLSSLPWFELDAFSRYDDTVRNQQVDALLASLRREPSPYIVAGDFNLSQYSASYEHIEEVMRDAFREAGWGWGNTWPAKLQSGLPVPLLLRLDYIWHSEDFAAFEVARGPKLASDHLPVYAVLGLE